MSTKKQIKEYIGSLPEAKQAEMETLHNMILEALPDCKLWYMDGTNEEGKLVTNPNIGYGSHTFAYADGKTRDFYKIGITANTGGISVYIMGIDDKKHLADAYGDKIGKATITGYCIKFKKLKDIHLDELIKAIQHEVEVAQ